MGIKKKSKVKLQEKSQEVGVGELLLLMRAFEQLLISLLSFRFIKKL